MAQQNKDEQKKLLTEIMEADQKNGLYENQMAVEWLAKELESYGNPQVCEINWEILDALINQAKQMEKKQIIDAFGIGCQVESTRLIGYHGMAEQYYNETYNK